MRRGRIGAVKHLRNLGLVGLWLIMLGLMIHSQIEDPPDPTLTGTAAYGHNSEGSLWQMGILSAVELAILYAIVRPWSFRRSIGRLALAVALLVPWALVSMVITMHAGSIVVIHFLWVSSALIALFIALVVTVYRWSRDRAR